MNFLAPASFFLGLLMPLIILLYLLKLRRVEHTVPSNYLWRKMIRDVEANAPWQKLRPNLLMILQLLFLAALITALSRPFSWSEGAGGQASIIIIDTSASMSAVDARPSRLESAKQRAQQLVEDMPDNAKATIIQAGKEAHVLLASSLDRRQAQIAIESIQPGTGGSDIAVALELASAISARQPGTEIVVLSDGKIDLPDRMVLKGQLRYIPFGLSGENQAISLLTIEESTSSEELTAFIQVSNYSDEPVTRRVSLFTNGLLVNVFDLENIPAGGQKSVIADGLPADTQIIEARLADEDILALDDRVITIKSETRSMKVTLMTRGNLFLKTAIALMPGIQLSEQIITDQPVVNDSTPTLEPDSTPASLSEPSPQGADLTIYDNYIPEEIITTGNILFIAPPQSTPFFTTTGLVSSPKLRVIDSSDILLNNISLSETNIQDAVIIPLPVWATPVIAGEIDNGNTPILIRGEVEGRRVAVLAFDIRHSDLPLQVAFPLLMNNLINWLSPGSEKNIPIQVDPGETISFPALNDSQTAFINRPDQQRIQLHAENNRFVFSDTDQLGLYELNCPDPSGDSADQLKTRYFAVNLLSPKESDIRPADNLSGITFENNVIAALSNQARREWWRYLALIGLGLLVGEWLIYQRAGLIRIYDMLRHFRIGLNR